MPQNKRNDSLQPNVLQQLLYPWSLQLTLTAPLVWKAKLLGPNKGRGDWPVFQASIHLTGYLKTSGLRGVSSFRGAGVSRHATSTSSSAISRFRLICSEKKNDRHMITTHHGHQTPARSRTKKTKHLSQSQMLHGTGIFTYTFTKKFKPLIDVGKYTIVPWRIPWNSQFPWWLLV